jgi:hypothetical protein
MPSNLAVRPRIAAQTQRSMDGALAGLAERQHGVVTRRQLLAAGATRHEVGRRIRLERLHAVYRGVYAVGHRALSADGRRMAAALAVSDTAVLSHRAAGSVHRLLRSDLLEVTLERKRRAVQGVRIHVSSLPPDEVTTVRGIRVTTVPRTLLDLAAVLPPHELERAINEAEFLQLTDPLSLVDLVLHYPRRRGIRKVKGILAKLQVDTVVTRSELESRFLAFVRKTNLPPPEVNGRAGPREVARVRLRLATLPCHRRARRTSGTRDHGRLRARPRPRSDAQRCRMACRSRHLAPVARGSAIRRGRPRDDVLLSRVRQLEARARPLRRREPARAGKRQVGGAKVLAAEADVCREDVARLDEVHDRAILG